MSRLLRPHALPSPQLDPLRPRRQRLPRNEPRTITLGELGAYVWREGVKPAFLYWGIVGGGLWALGMIFHAFGLL